MYTMYTWIKGNWNSYINMWKVKENCFGLKRTIHNDKQVNSPEDTAILNVYALNNRASKYIKPKLVEMKRQIHNYSYRIQFSSVIEKNRRHKIIKDIIWTPPVAKWILLTSIEHSTQNIHSFQMVIEHSPNQTIYWVINIYLKELKLSKLCCRAIM